MGHAEAAVKEKPGEKKKAKAKAGEGSRGWFRFGAAWWSLAGVATLAAGLVVVWQRVTVLDTTLATATNEIQTSLDSQATLNESVSEGLTQLSKSVIASEAANQSVANQIESLSGQIGGLTETLAGEIAELRRSQQALGDTVVTLGDVTARHDERFGEMEGQLAVAGAGLEKLAVEAREANAALAGQVGGQAVRIGELEAALATATESFTALNAMVDAMRSDQATAKSELAAVRERYADEQARVAELAASLQAVEAELALALSVPAASGSGWGAFDGLTGSESSAAPAEEGQELVGPPHVVEEELEL